MSGSRSYNFVIPTMMAFNAKAKPCRTITVQKKLKMMNQVQKNLNEGMSLRYSCDLLGIQASQYNHWKTIKNKLLSCRKTAGSVHVGCTSSIAHLEDHLLEFFFEQ